MVDSTNVSKAIDDLALREELFKPYFEEHSKDKKNIKPSSIQEIIMGICDEQGWEIPSKQELEAAKGAVSGKAAEDEDRSYDEFLKEIKLYLVCINAKL